MKHNLKEDTQQPLSRFLSLIKPSDHKSHNEMIQTTHVNDTNLKTTHPKRTAQTKSTTKTNLARSSKRSNYKCMF